MRDIDEVLETRGYTLEQVNLHRLAPRACGREQRQGLDAAVQFVEAMKVAERCLYRMRVVTTTEDKSPTRIIQAIVAEAHGIKVAHLLSARRASELVMPRREAIYAVHQLTGLALNAIGRMFGGRHHTTIMHNICKLQEGMAASPAYAAHVNALIDRCEAALPV